MSGFRERDFFKRMIQQLAQGIARALKLRREKKFDQARQALGETFDDLVGVPRSLVDRLDAPGAAQLVGDAEKLRVWVQLLKEEAAIVDDEGGDSMPLRLRARQLLVEAVRRSSETAEDRALMESLTKKE